MHINKISNFHSYDFINLPEFIKIESFKAIRKNSYRFGFAHIGRVGSVFATLMVTIERFVAVWCPLQRLKSTKTLLSISIIGSLIYNVPRFLEFKSTTVCVNEYHYAQPDPSQQPMQLMDDSSTVVENSNHCPEQYPIKVP